MKITIFEESNYKQFFNDNNDIKSYIHMIERWSESKKYTLPSYKTFGFDKKGCVYLKYNLPGQGNWCLLSLLELEMLNESM